MSDQQVFEGDFGNVENTSEDIDWLYSNEDLDVNPDQENVLLQPYGYEQELVNYEEEELPFAMPPPPGQAPTLEELFGYELQNNNEDGQLIENEIGHQGVQAGMEIMTAMYGEQYGPPGA